MTPLSGANRARLVLVLVLLLSGALRDSIELSTTNELENSSVDTAKENSDSAVNALADAKQEIGVRRLREQRLREALREIAKRLPPVGQSIYSQVLTRAGLIDWISVR